jgi:3-dehydroquinate synthase
MPPSSSLRSIRIGLPGAARGSYPFCVGSGILPALGRRLLGLKALKGPKAMVPGGGVFVVTDSNVGPLYGAPLVSSLAKAGLRATLLQVRAGEKSKTRETKARLEDRMLALGAGRDSAVIALGGGMITDLAGFTAATLHRGVPFVAVPTTLLAMVDAAVGGKTAVDHPRGKNLIGAFHPPRAVFADVATLATLPERQFRSGLAEVVKTAVLGDEALFRRLERSPAAFLMRHPGALADLVAACCRVKGRVVEADERESNLRAVLNFGHTLGHALELLSAYRLPHGEAVSIGMALESRAAAAAGILLWKEADRIVALLKALGLPVRPRGRFSPARVLSAARSDKKARGGELRYALPRRIGRMASKKGRYALPLPDSLVLEVLRRA